MRPRVCLYVHTYADREPEPDASAGGAVGVVRVEGHGPVTHAWVRRWLGPHARFTIRPVLDLAGQAPVDCWEIPERHRRAVHLMTPADTFPFASTPPRKPLTVELWHSPITIDLADDYAVA